MTTTYKTTDFSLPTWARTRVQEMIADIQSYIDNGWEPVDAVTFVLDASCLGTSYKETVRAHFA